VIILRHVSFAQITCATVVDKRAVGEESGLRQRSSCRNWWAFFYIDILCLQLDLIGFNSRQQCGLRREFGSDEIGLHWIAAAVNN